MITRQTIVLLIDVIRLTDIFENMYTNKYINISVIKRTIELVRSSEPPIIIFNFIGVPLFFTGFILYTIKNIPSAVMKIIVSTGLKLNICVIITILDSKSNKQIFNNLFKKAKDTTLKHIYFEYIGI